MKRIMIFFHSGAGSTKLIAGILKDMLSEHFDVEMALVDDDYDFDKIKLFDCLVFGFPVYGFDASASMKEFAGRIPVLDKPIKCFLFSTMALVSGNSSSRLAIKLFEKNIATCGYIKIYAPASDGALLFPASWKWVRSFRKGTLARIEKFISEIRDAVENNNFKINMPAKKFYWTVVEKLLLKPSLKQARKYMDSLHAIEDRCGRCNLCVKMCRRGCITAGKNHPVFDTGNCDFCLRCVHHCPGKAITFMKGYIDKPRLDDKFFKEARAEILRKPE